MRTTDDALILDPIRCRLILMPPSNTTPTLLLPSPVLTSPCTMLPRLEAMVLLHLTCHRTRRLMLLVPNIMVPLMDHRCMVPLVWLVRH